MRRRWRPHGRTPTDNLRAIRRQNPESSRRTTLTAIQPPSPFFALAGHLAIDLPGARAVFTTRRGGHSVGPYASLNLGFATEDAPAAMAANRATLRSAIGCPPLQFVYQVHGSDIRRIVDIPPAAERPAADGQVTRRKEVAVAVLTADCLPIAVAGGGAVAMLHAGWRGLASGVIAAGVGALRELAAGGDGNPPARDAAFCAAIGPGAGPCCYEVGEEVRSAFSAYDGACHGSHLDLKAVARAQLVAAGVCVDDVHDVDLCTLCAPADLLYSHRRDHGVTGRQAGVAWLT